MGVKDDIKQYSLLYSGSEQRAARKDCIKVLVD